MYVYLRCEDNGFDSLRRLCRSILLFVCAEPGERQVLLCGAESENGWNSDPNKLCTAMTHQQIRAEVCIIHILMTVSEWCHSS